MSDCRHNAPNRGPETGDVQTQRQQLDEQTREELVDRLVDCLYSFEGEPNIDALDRCLEELDGAGADGAAFDVEQGLQAFHERFDAAFEGSVKEVKKPPRYRRSLARIAIIAAVLCAFMFTAQASGLDIFGAIARWTSEQFSFVKAGEEKFPHQSDVTTSLLGTLVDLGITDTLAPTKFPEGAELSDIRVRAEEKGTLISAVYAYGSENFFIAIGEAIDAPYGNIEINDPDIEIYSSGGIEHHLMADVMQRKATWHNNGWECYIAGDLTREDLVLMIDSIYE